MVPLEGAGVPERSRCSQVGKACAPAAMLMKNEARGSAASSFAYSKPGNLSGGNIETSAGAETCEKLEDRESWQGKKKSGTGSEIGGGRGSARLARLANELCRYGGGGGQLPF